VHGLPPPPSWFNVGLDFMPESPIVLTSRNEAKARVNRSALFISLLHIRELKNFWFG